MTPLVSQHTRDLVSNASDQSASALWPPLALAALCLIGGLAIGWLIARDK